MARKTATDTPPDPTEQRIEIAPGKFVTVRRKRITDYTPDRLNLNAGSQRGQKMIEGSIHETGAGRSLVVDREGNVIAGNHAQQGFVDTGFEDVLEIETEGGVVIAHKRADMDLYDPEDARARRYAAFDNRTSEVSFNIDPGVFAELLKRDSTTFDGMYTPLEIAQILGAGLEEDDAVEQMDDSLGVYKLDDTVMFEGAGPMELPPILGEMVPDWSEVEDMRLWPGDDLAKSYGVFDDDAPIMYIYGTSNQTVPWDRAWIGYFAYDDKLDPVYDNAAKTTSRWLNAGVRGVLGVEWTLTDGHPLPMNLWQLYKTRWMTRFMQQAGLKVIPDAGTPGGKMDDWVFDGVPVGCPVIAMNVQSADFKNKAQREFMEHSIRHSLNTIKPDGVVFYGSKAGRDFAFALMETDYPKTKYSLIPSLMDHRRKKLSDTKKAMGRRAQPDEAE